MAAINSTSLLHFTSKLSVLKKILTKGLRHSYAFESFPDDVISNHLSSTDYKIGNIDMESNASGPGIAILS